MDNQQMIKWIDSASYGELLNKWRFASIGDPIFQGEVGDYYATAMRQKREHVENDEHVKISKEVGW